jgi:hypothetical protein
LYFVQFDNLSVSLYVFRAPYMGYYVASRYRKQCWALNMAIKQRRTVKHQWLSMNEITILYKWLSNTLNKTELLQYDTKNQPYENAVAEE